MTTRLKHTDDDGDLSIFVSGDEVLFACNHGHAWTAQVSVHIHTCRLDHTEFDHTEFDHVEFDHVEFDHGELDHGELDRGEEASPADRPSPPTHGAA